MGKIRKKKKNNSKHFFYDSKLSIVVYIVYLLLIVFYFRVEHISEFGLMFALTLFGYLSALVLPEYVDKKKNDWGSKIVMWLTRVMFVLGVIYAINDAIQPCDWFCFTGLAGLVALAGLVVFPILIVIVYLIISWIIVRRRKK